MDTATGLNIGRKCALVAAAVLFGASSALAVEPRVYQLDNGGAIAPHLTLQFGQDSNPLRGENGSESSGYLVVEPDVRFILQRRNNRLTLGYNGEYLQYLTNYCSEPVAENPGFGLPNAVQRSGDCSSGASPTFNKASYQNHALSLNGFLEFSSRARGNIAIQTSQVHQPLGTGLSSADNVLSVLSEPDSYVRNSVFAGFSYGAYRARGELRLGLSYWDRKFRNNGGRDLGNLSEQSLAPSASLFYRVGTRTQVFAGLSVSDITGGSAVRTIERRFVGMEFDASSITSGSVRLIDVSEDFEDRSRDLGYTGFDVNLVWKPRRFSTVTIGGGRQSERATFAEDGVGITTRLQVDWLHYWRERFSTNVELGITRNDSDSRLQSNDANDRTNSLRLEGNYNIRRWLDVGAFAQSESRSGVNVDGGGRDYSRSLVGITTNGTF